MVISLSGITRAGAVGHMNSCQKAQIRVPSITLEMHIIFLHVCNNLANKYSRTVHKNGPRFIPGAVFYIVWMRIK